MILTDSTRFVRPKFNVLGDCSRELELDAIQSLPDLISFNATRNPSCLFCLQAESSNNVDASNTAPEPFSLLPITFRQLANAVDVCATVLRKSLPYQCLSRHSKGEQSIALAPVALLLESNVGLFIHLAALLAMQIPVVLLSARLSATSVRHLLKETGAACLLVSKRTKLAVVDQVEDLAILQQALPYHNFLQVYGQDWSESLFSKPFNIDGSSANALILHSSGTTGLPKPIHLAQRYLLGYAACHEFSEQEDVSRLNLSTLPLYHGFGLLAPCLSLSVGMTCCFPPSSIVPAAHSMLELLSMIEVQSLMTVPSILEDMLHMPESEVATAVSLLRPLHFVAVGGGPMKPSTAQSLANQGVNVLNHYGATEIGAIAPIFRPSADYDWHYLRLRKDIGLRLRPVAEPKIGDVCKFRLVGQPFGWDNEFEIQDELETRASGEHTEVRILGRTDDVIVLKTGEKVDPRLYEESLGKDLRVEAAICVGQGRFELIILVKPSRPAPADIELFRQEIWDTISGVSPSMDKHAQIASKNAIVFLLDESKPIPRSDKGSFMRRETHVLFDEEIQKAYDALEMESSYSVVLPTDASGLEIELQKLIKLILGAKFESLQLRPHDDIFEIGMDSLHAARLARALKASVFHTIGESKPLSKLCPRFVYQHPSVCQLAKGLLREHLGELSHTVQALPRNQHMQALLEKYLSGLQAVVEAEAPYGNSSGEQDGDGKTRVLLTGSTGNLGAHVLAYLAADPSVQKIYCLNRCTLSSTLAETTQNLVARQKSANSSAGVVITSEAWEKIEFVPARVQDLSANLSTIHHEDIVTNVTHIVHLAWPMDFQRTLPSFAPQLDLLMYLVGLATAINVRRPSRRPKLLFASSISVVRNFKKTNGSSMIAEQPVTDPLVTTPMGYAEAKWVCEQVLDHSSQKHSARFESQIVRIGQLSGPIQDGVWKTEEHIPKLFKVSQELGAFPRLPGNYSWIPVDIAAKSLLEILFSSRSQPLNSGPFYHLENPIRQPFHDLATHATHVLQLPQRPIAFSDWLSRLKTTKTESASGLLDFFAEDFADLASGEVVLDTRVSRSVSATLRSCGGVDAELIGAYVGRWRRMGFLA